jgi:hypothetical protein
MPVIMLAGVGSAVADVSAPELALVASRNRIANLYVECHTTAKGTERDVADSPRRFIDRYWLVGTSWRRDDFKEGSLDGTYYRYVNTRDVSTFFTNEFNQLGGKNVVELRTTLEHIPDIRHIGFGVGVVRQGEKWPLVLVGQVPTAKREIAQEQFGGEICNKISYSANGAQCIMWLAQKDNEPRRFTLESTLPNGQSERHEVDVELQEVAGDDGQLRFPKEIVCKKYVGSTLVKEAVQTVRQIDLKFSEDGVFQLRALQIPVGHPIYDFRRATGQQGYWNGKDVEYGEPEADVLAPTLNVSMQQLMLLAAVLCAFLAWIIHRWRVSTH